MGQDKLMRRIEQRFAKGIIKYGLIMKPRSIRLLTPGSRLVFFAPGTGARPFLHWPRNWDVIKLPWDITWMIS